MGALERDTQVFIVRFWQEPREIEGVDAIARGVVEHVASGTRQHVADLDEVAAFMARFVGGAFRRRSLKSRMRKWLGR